MKAGKAVIFSLLPLKKELYVAAASVSLHGIPERWELVLSVMEVSQENWL